MSDVRADLVEVNVGGVSLRAPGDSPRVFRGSYGRMWQWLGDGRLPLISLTVATRRSRIGSSLGVKRHLNWEVDRLCASLETSDDQSSVQEVPISVSGARAVRGAVLDGLRSGIRTHNRIVVASDESRMHVIHVMVPDTENGREFAYSLTMGMSLEGRRSVDSDGGGLG